MSSPTIMVFGGQPLTRLVPENMGIPIPTDAQVVAAGGITQTVVKDPVAGSWDTFAGLVATAGYIRLNVAGTNNPILIPTLIKTVFP